MTVFLFAYYRCARQQMTRDEVETAQALAAKADGGSAGAATALTAMCEAVFKRKRREILDGKTYGGHKRKTRDGQCSVPAVARAD